MRKFVTTVALLALTSTVYGAKCRGGKSILYTQDQYCPAGYTDVTTTLEGTVSTTGKSENVVRQEQEFLQRRAIENGQHQAQLAQAQQQYARQQQTSNASLCSALADQARSIEAALRQPNSAQWLDSLKQQNRNVRDQMYRNRC